MGEKSETWRLCWFLISLFFAGCVSLPRSFQALSYRNQTVYLGSHHHYRVGALSDSWQMEADKGPGIIFKHKSGARLATNAICGAAFEDLSLELLTSHLLMGLESVKKVKEERLSLSGREALHTVADASLDGVPVELNTVVIKKDRCQFDFLAASPLQFSKEISKDFENFVKGFEY